MQDTLKKFEEKIWRIKFELPSLQSQITRDIVLKYGSLAQLVQSICLTSRGSAVRTRQLPLNKALIINDLSRLFCFYGFLVFSICKQFANKKLKPLKFWIHM
jgi:hypothetical protein